MRENKAAVLREHSSVEEIRHKVLELNEELFNLRFRNSVKQLDNPLKIREVRRDLARMLTLLHEHDKGIRRLAEHAGVAK
jgi:large subunit ribosomal protein L29